MGIRDLIVPNKMYHYKEGDENDISEAAYKKIVSLVSTHTGHEIGSIIGTSWVDENNKYPGKLPARIDAYFKNHYSNRGISPELKKMIGDIAHEGMVKGGSYNFKFDTAINWEAGTFGDNDACFIKGGLSTQVVALRNNEAYALQFFDEKNKGLARSWCIFTDVDCEITPTEYQDMYDQFLVLCNAYNKGMGLNLLRQAKVVAGALNLKLAQVTAYKKGTGSFYTNGNSNIALYYNDKELPIKSVLFTLSDNPPVMCHNCHKKKQLYRTIGENKFCQICYNENYFECGSCGKNLPNEESNSLRGRKYCKKCFAKFMPCQSCGEKNTPNSLYTVAINKFQENWCADCVRRKAKSCDRCNKFVASGEVKELEDYKYCEECFAYLLTECFQCKKPSRKGNMVRVKVNGEYVLCCKAHKIEVCYDCDAYILTDVPCEHKKKGRRVATKKNK